MKSVFQRKFPEKLDALNYFIVTMMVQINVVKVPEEKSKYKIRDEKDESILRTALYHNVDIILTGDKDFDDLEMNKPKVITPSEYLTGVYL